MGACLPKNTRKKDETADEPEVIKPRYPLNKLKRQLQAKLNLTEDHHFNTFVQYSFWKSHRRELNKLEKRQRAQAEREYREKLAEMQAGLNGQAQPILSAEAFMNKYKKENEAHQDENMLLATWFEDPLNLQKENDVSNLDSFNNVST